MWIDQLRRKKVVGRTLPLNEDIVAETSHKSEMVWTNAEDLMENFSDEQIIRALRGLPEDQRLTLFLIDVEQLSQNEVAQITGVPAGTVKSRTSRARTVLKEKLAPYVKEIRLTAE